MHCIASPFPICHRLVSIPPARLQQNLPDREQLEREVAAWEEERNGLGGAVNWRFTTEDARVKLKRLYPSHDG